MSLDGVGNHSIAEMKLRKGLISVSVMMNPAKSTSSRKLESRFVQDDAIGFE